MSRNDDAIIKRLNELYKVEEQSIKKLPLNINDKYALFSDLHLGDGGKVDNFIHNEETMGFALKYYKNNGYSIILLGDVGVNPYFSVKLRYHQFLPGPDSFL